MDIEKCIDSDDDNDVTEDFNATQGEEEKYNDDNDVIEDYSTVRTRR